MKNDSFFNFFAPPAIPENEEELDEDTQELITSDFEIGHYIRERIIPRAVLFFTGETERSGFSKQFILLCLIYEPRAASAF